MSESAKEAAAKIYAEVLFELARESQANETVYQEMQALAELITGNADFAAFLESPAVSREYKKNMLAKVFSGRFSDLTMKFLAVTAARDRLGLLPAILSVYKELEDARTGLVKGTLTTAVALENTEHLRYAEQIGRALQKKMVLQTKVDPSNLGGLILKVGDTIMDGSLLGALQRMARQLQKKPVPAAASVILEE